MKKKNRQVNKQNKNRPTLKESINNSFFLFIISKSENLALSFRNFLTNIQLHDKTKAKTKQEKTTYEATANSREFLFFNSTKKQATKTTFEATANSR